MVIIITETCVEKCDYCDICRWMSGRVFGQCVCKWADGQAGRQRSLCVAYLWTAGVEGAESEQPGLVVLEEGSGPGTHTSFEPPSCQSPSLAAAKSAVSTLITVERRSDELRCVTHAKLTHTTEHTVCVKTFISLRGSYASDVVSMSAC